MVEKKIGFKCVEFKSDDTVGVTNSFNSSHNFTFDRVYDDLSSQELIYSETAKPLIGDILKGYNGTIFTYGISVFFCYIYITKSFIYIIIIYLLRRKNICIDLLNKLIRAFIIIKLTNVK